MHGLDYQLITVSPRVRAEARYVLRLIDGHPKPAVAKVGDYWHAYDGKGRSRAYRTWRGAMRAVSN